MRLPDEAHTGRPWRIHALRPGLRVEDVWALPARGGAGDFARLVDLVTGIDPARMGSRPVRALFALRARIGALLGWDGDEPAGASAFAPILHTDREFAAEIFNRTVHGVLHLGWVEERPGVHRGRLAVLVAPNGRLGRAYMAAIRPFRHAVVYPALLREIDRRWKAA